jgi:hypothetical protein
MGNLESSFYSSRDLHASIQEGKPKAPELLTQVELHTGVPVIPHGADPTVYTDKSGRVHLLTTQSYVENTGEFHNMQEFISDNGVEFRQLPDAMPFSPLWTHEHRNIWAPATTNGLIVYYSGKTIHGAHAIGVATRETLDEPLVPHAQPLIYGRPGFADIDPSIREVPSEEDPSLFETEIIYGSGGLPIMRRRASLDGLSLKSGIAETLAVCTKYKQYESLLEAPELVTFYSQKKGKPVTTLLTSGHNTRGRINDDATKPYGESYAINSYSANAFGREQCMNDISYSASPHGSPIFRGNYEAGIVNPGHHETFLDALGNPWMYYTAINLNKCEGEPITGDVNRTVYLEPIRVDDEGRPYFDYGMPYPRTILGPALRIVDAQ